MSSKTTDQFAIVLRIAAFLKLGDSGKLQSFFQRIVKILTREIEALKKNIESTKFNSQQVVEDLKDQLQDAEEALAEQFMAVSPDQVSDNALQKAHVDVYLEGLAEKEAIIAALKEKMEKEEEKCKDTIKGFQVGIDSRVIRIETIKK